MIWLSEKRDVFMQNLPAFRLRKILLLSTSVFRGDYQAAELGELGALIEQQAHFGRRVIQKKK